MKPQNLKTRKPNFSSTLSTAIWTLSGIVLAACQGTGTSGGGVSLAGGSSADSNAYSLSDPSGLALNDGRLEHDAPLAVEIRNEEGEVVETIRTATRPAGGDTPATLPAPAGLQPSLVYLLDDGNGDAELRTGTRPVFESDTGPAGTEGYIIGVIDAMGMLHLVESNGNLPNVAPEITDAVVHDSIIDGRADDKSASGYLAHADINTGQTASYSFSTDGVNFTGLDENNQWQGQFGTLTFTPDGDGGAWVYVIDPERLDDLDAGEHTTETIYARVADSDGAAGVFIQPISISITKSDTPINMDIPVGDNPDGDDVPMQDEPLPNDPNAGNPDPMDDFGDPVIGDPPADGDTPMQDEPQPNDPNAGNPDNGGGGGDDPVIVDPPVAEPVLGMTLSLTDAHYTALIGGVAYRAVDATDYSGYELRFVYEALGFAAILASPAIDTNPANPHITFEYGRFEQTAGLSIFDTQHELVRMVNNGSPDFADNNPGLRTDIGDASTSRFSAWVYDERTDSSADGLRTWHTAIEQDIDGTGFTNTDPDGTGTGLNVRGWTADEDYRWGGGATGTADWDATTAGEQFVLQNAFARLVYESGDYMVGLVDQTGGREYGGSEAARTIGTLSSRAGPDATVSLAALGEGGYLSDNSIESGYFANALFTLDADALLTINADAVTGYYDDNATLPILVKVDPDGDPNTDNGFFETFVIGLRNNPFEVDAAAATISGTAGDDVFAAGFAGRVANGSDAEILIGGAGADTIRTLGGEDHVLGGYGADTINLTDGVAETVYVRFASNAGGFDLVDGGDTINNFTRGEDNLVLVDVDDTPLDYAGFVGTDGVLNPLNGISVNHDFRNLDFNPTNGVVTQIRLRFDGTQTPEDGPGGTGTASGDTLTVNWSAAIRGPELHNFVAPTFTAGSAFTDSTLLNPEAYARYFANFFGGTDHVDVVDDDRLNEALSFEIV